jgi:hypothetical protein
MLLQFVLGMGVVWAVLRLSGVALAMFVIAVLAFAGFLFWRGALRAR